MQRRVFRTFGQEEEEGGHFCALLARLPRAARANYSSADKVRRPKRATCGRRLRAVAISTSFQSAAKAPGRPGQQVKQVGAFVCFWPAQRGAEPEQQRLSRRDLSRSRW